MSNIKTTIGGICMVLAGVGGIGMTITGNGETPYEVNIGLITGGVALILARDAGTGSDAPVE
jgi:hypothetical protein